MKIESSTKPVVAPQANEARGHSPGRAAALATSDEVRLSALAAQLGVPDDEQSFDVARVAEIKQAISEGRFAINAGTIADRLIASAKELVDNQRQA